MSFAAKDYVSLRYSHTIMVHWTHYKYTSEAVSSLTSAWTGTGVTYGHRKCYHWVWRISHCEWYV